MSENIRKLYINFLKIKKPIKLNCLHVDGWIYFWNDPGWGIMDIMEIMSLYI